MATQPHNPFVLPGFGQSGGLANNPLMASMEMMRQAWQGLANAGGLDHSAVATPMSIDDLDRRISDLRAVENWLRMNLSMLSSTIQGLEVQRATISTLKSFMSSTASAAGGTAPAGPSPLEVVLGIKPDASRGAPEPAPEPETPQDQAAAAQGVNAAAAQGWWDMLQQQFDNLASATAATLQSAETARAAAAAAAQQSAQASSDSTLGRQPPRKPAKKAARTATASRPAKKTARKTPARKRTPGAAGQGS
ncbi:transcriptional regulator [Pusillimonas sp. SM2304]|uniref:PhaM family polyhydroxyalkanoate granule multifunctional regulatory protein n=1 Tax=Pusillimonas sp. SM2304 TaxID=3073241 RepID=UPI002875CE14|nr:PhaM family polyhydroxyalkanoate granule multifunctional regulatory protein [Pusillimonas sp. SM2304]MDS1139512.1 transcriptional regulator [Pusillimonas sp. SM2304]